MRLCYLIITASLLATTTSLAASQTIDQSELDNTMLHAQQAITSRDYDKAFELYGQAAEWGHNGAQYVLGEMYLRGEGTEKNEVLGLAWLDVAAESRNRDFVKAHKNAAASLSDSDVQKAEKLADKISAVYGIEAAQLTCKREMRVGSNIKITNCYHKSAGGNSIVVPDDQGDMMAQLKLMQEQQS